MSEAGVVRRLTTILAADVAGYSRLMATDEEATLARLRAYRKVIDTLVAKHDGRVFNTAGDAVLAEFGSAVEAVRCAVSIQEELSVRNAQLGDDERMWFRIGINVGDVMIEGDDLFGDGVNVAARLEGLAEKGGICISGSTFEQVKNKLSVAFSDIGPQTVKNIPEPVAAFRVVPGQVSVKSEMETAEPRTLSGAPKLNGRRLVFAGVAVLAILLAGFLVWLLSAPPSGPNYPFDGRWQVSVHSRSGCLSNDDRTYPITVARGLIDEPHHRLPKTGTVSDDGAFRIEVTSKDGRLMNRQEGRIEGDIGQGRFIGAKPTCTGSVTIERVN
jgi:class 3 adenylate cyclase